VFPSRLRAIDCDNNPIKNIEVFSLKKWFRYKDCPWQRRD